MTECYPWQQAAWQQFEQRVEAGRLAHGLLLAGPDGSGTTDFARQMAEHLLGADADDRARTLLGAGSHPDLQILQPPEAGKAIRVDAVRVLINFLSLTTQYGRYKVAIIQPAEAMNRHAANTLLKTLEEPPAQSVLILVSGQPARLPVTIRSRCQILDLTPRIGAATIEWLRHEMPDDKADPEKLLAAADAAPLAALALSEEGGLALRDQLLDDLVALERDRADPMATAERWTRAGAAAVYIWLYRLTRDMVRYRLLGMQGIINQDAGRAFRDLTANRSLRQVMNIHDLVIKNNHLLTGPYSPNEAALLEDFIFNWLGAAETERT